VQEAAEDVDAAVAVNGDPLRDLVRGAAQFACGTRRPTSTARPAAPPFSMLPE
jgi:hypothetical protein